MFGNENPPPTIPSQEDALAFIVQTLRDTTDNLEYYEIRMTRVFDLYLRNVCRHQGQLDAGYRHIAPIFCTAAWDLCRRGVLLPGLVSRIGQIASNDGSYTVTPAGARRIRETADALPLPLELGRFSKLLDNFTARFGGGYRERSQEALRCYGADAHLSCCAMCGAAAESVLLAVAIAKDGSQDRIETQYKAHGRRGGSETWVLGSQPENVQSECRGYLGLLMYWGDLTHHAKASGIAEGEAYTALILLLRLSQFVNDHWDELTERAN